MQSFFKDHVNCIRIDLCIRLRVRSLRL